MHDLWPKVVEETKTRNPLKLCSWQRWEITQANHNFLGVSNKVNRRSHLKGVFFSKRTVTTSVLSVCQMFAKCADDPQVLELLQKCFVRIKKQNKFTAVSHENRAKKLKKKTATTIIKKKRLIRCWICLSKAWNFY